MAACDAFAVITTLPLASQHGSSARCLKSEAISLVGGRCWSCAWCPDGAGNVAILPANEQCSSRHARGGGCDLDRGISRLFDLSLHPNVIADKRPLRTQLPLYPSPRPCAGVHRAASRGVGGASAMSEVKWTPAQGRGDDACCVRSNLIVRAPAKAGAQDRMGFASLTLGACLRRRTRQAQPFFNIVASSS